MLQHPTVIIARGDEGSKAFENYLPSIHNLIHSQKKSLHVLQQCPSFNIFPTVSQQKHVKLFGHKNKKFCSSSVEWKTDAKTYLNIWLSESNRQFRTAMSISCWKWQNVSESVHVKWAHIVYYHLGKWQSRCNMCVIASVVFFYHYSSKLVWILICQTSCKTPLFCSGWGYFNWEMGIKVK